MSEPVGQALAGDRIARFVRRFGETHRRLAWYAALPLVLTPDLLDSLRLHFLGGRDGVPWIAEADLLLSDLCRPVGYEQYAMDQPVRAALLAELRAALGPAPLREAARLLLGYVRHLGRSGAGLGPAELQAEQWSAMAYLDECRGQAAREIAAAFASNLAAATAADAPALAIPAAELARLVRITDDLAPNLADHPGLIEYAAEVAALLREPDGLRERLAQASGRTQEIAGVRLPVLAEPPKSSATKAEERTMFELLDTQSQFAVIKVIGIGGGGNNAVNHMANAEIEGVDFICADTDGQALRASRVKTVLSLGAGITKRQGTGTDPEVGRRAAEEDRDRIKDALAGADMVFITAGMGGGTGTGAAPVVAQVARELGILTVALINKPFAFEGGKRAKVAAAGIVELAKYVDSLITIPNEKLVAVLGKDMSLLSAFSAANDVLLNLVQGIAALINQPGLINVDFADVKTVMSGMGVSMTGTGVAAGENRARIAAENAIKSPLLEDINLAGAKGILVNITAGLSLSIGEFDEVGNTVRDFADDEATVVVGTVIDPDMKDELRVTVVATGLGERRSAPAGRMARREEPKIRLVTNDAEEPATGVLPDYRDMEQPAYIRNRRAAADGYNAADLDYLDIPAFLRRQADVPSVSSSLRHPLELLNPPCTSDKPLNDAMIKSRSRELEQTLQDFGVIAAVTAVYPGPVVTLFDLRLAAGTKATEIAGRARELERALSTERVRLVERTPWKLAVGIEIPNAHRETVCLREILDSAAYREAKSPLMMALGANSAGEPVVADLARMPHALIAGTTGSGKSVAINAMILSLVYKAGPEDLRLIMVDPKMRELSVYEGISHLLTPVVTDMKEAANALRWCVGEMERRYKLMSRLGVRNIAGYNRKVEDAIAAGEPLPNPLFNPIEGIDTAPPTLGKLPYIVVIVDELADMMMVVGKKVEKLIARLAQKGRAFGIHLLLATQRPSVDVLTRLIKANIPTRIAFRVSERVDSRTVLDQMGAEHLLGYGDMLYLQGGGSIPQRVHGAFVDDHEVRKVVECLKLQGPPQYIDAILQEPS